MGWLRDWFYFSVIHDLMREIPSTQVKCPACYLAYLFHSYNSLLHSPPSNEMHLDVCISGEHASKQWPFADPALTGGFHLVLGGAREYSPSHSPLLWLSLQREDLMVCSEPSSRYFVQRLEVIRTDWRQVRRCRKEATWSSLHREGWLQVGEPHLRVAWDGE